MSFDGLNGTAVEAERRGRRASAHNRALLDSRPIKDAALRGVHGAPGEPGWHLLTGTVAKDGSAALSLEGIVNSPDHSVNNAYRGKSYSYRVRATFDASSGVGQRVGKRKCTFRFDRAG